MNGENIHSYYTTTLHKPLEHLVFPGLGAENMENNKWAMN